MSNINYKAFTSSYQGLVNVIKTAVHISPFREHNLKKETIAIWDTGATNSVITQSFAENLGLQPIGRTITRGVHGLQEVNSYLVDIILPNDTTVTGLKVTECKSLSTDGHCSLLIGMDVILLGDFAISNKNKKTVFTFRMPSKKRTDYVEEIKLENKVAEQISHRKTKSSNRTIRRKLEKASKKKKRR